MKQENCPLWCHKLHFSHVGIRKVYIFHSNLFLCLVALSNPTPNKWPRCFVSFQQIVILSAVGCKQRANHAFIYYTFNNYSYEAPLALFKKNGKNKEFKERKYILKLKCLSFNSNRILCPLRWMSLTPAEWKNNKSVLPASAQYLNVALPVQMWPRTAWAEPCPPSQAVTRTTLTCLPRPGAAPWLSSARSRSCWSTSPPFWVSGIRSFQSCYVVSRSFIPLLKVDEGRHLVPASFHPQLQ